MKTDLQNFDIYAPFSTLTMLKKIRLKREFEHHFVLNYIFNSTPER